MLRNIPTNYPRRKIKRNKKKKKCGTLQDSSLF